MLQPYLSEAGQANSAIWQAIEKQTAELTDRGLRVLLIARHPDPKLLIDQGDESRLPEDMQPIGLISLSDELARRSQRNAAALQRRGVQPQDHLRGQSGNVGGASPQAGLPDDITLVSGLELNEMSGRAICGGAQKATIFGAHHAAAKKKN